MGIAGGKGDIRGWGGWARVGEGLMGGGKGGGKGGGGEKEGGCGMERGGGGEGGGRGDFGLCSLLMQPVRNG